MKYIIKKEIEIPKIADVYYSFKNGEFQITNIDKKNKTILLTFERIFNDWQGRPINQSLINWETWGFKYLPVSKKVY
tara:strand:- start:20 stop:250 length:231 start_codon:yes stop_codon:yes gene_type:complete